MQEDAWGAEEAAAAVDLRLGEGFRIQIPRFLGVFTA